MQWVTLTESCSLVLRVLSQVSASLLPTGTLPLISCTFSISRDTMTCLPRAQHSLLSSEFLFHLVIVISPPCAVTRLPWPKCDKNPAAQSVLWWRFPPYTFHGIIYQIGLGRKSKTIGESEFSLQALIENSFSELEGCRPQIRQASLRHESRRIPVCLACCPSGRTWLCNPDV